MRRLASHFIYCGGIRRMSYLELDEEDRFRGIYPLREEIAGTAFYDGILIPLLADKSLLPFEKRLLSLAGNSVFVTKAQVFDFLAATGLTDPVKTGMPVTVYLLGGISLTGDLQTAAKFRTDDGRCHSYIQRL